MSWIQSLVQKHLPEGWASMIEEESRQWAMTCGNCGWQASVWEMGGIRFKARGKPKKAAKCPKCGGVRWFTLSRGVV